MELSQPLAARTRNAAAASTAVHSPPSIGQLTILSNTLPTLVHAHQEASRRNFPGGYSHGVSHTSPCSYMAAAYGQGSPSGAASSSYPIAHHHQTQQHHCNVYSLLGSGSSLPSSNNGHLYLSSAQSCAGRHHNHPVDTSASNPPTIWNPSSAQTSSYFDAATATAMDISLLAAAVSATSSPPPLGVPVNNNNVTSNNNVRFMQELEGTIESDRNRHQLHQQQQALVATHARRAALSVATVALSYESSGAASAAASPPTLGPRSNNGSSNARLMQEFGATTMEADRSRHQLHNQQQVFATHARQTALSAATAALSHDSSGRLLSPPLSVEELALDVSTLEHALGNSSAPSVRLFSPYDNDETLLHQGVAGEEEIINPMAEVRNRRESIPEASTSSNLSPPISFGNSATTNYAVANYPDVSILGSRTTVSSCRAAAVPRREPRKTNTRTSARAAKAQERKTHATKRGAQQELPQEQPECSRTSCTATPNMASERISAPFSVASFNTPDPVLSNRSPPSESNFTEDKKKPAMKRTKKDDKKAPPSKIKVDEENICCICMDVCSKLELASINSCKHKFCFSCIEKWADRENTCPLCKERFSKIERVHKPPSRKRKGDSATSPTRHRNTKKVKNRSQRSDFITSNAFQGLLGESTCEPSLN